MSSVSCLCQKSSELLSSELSGCSDFSGGSHGPELCTSTGVSPAST